MSSEGAMNELGGAVAGSDQFQFCANCGIQTNASGGTCVSCLMAADWVAEPRCLTPGCEYKPLPRIGYCPTCDGKRERKPLFESNAGATIERVESTFSQRGSEYGDTWANCQFLNMKAVARKFSIPIPDKFLRVLCVAGFCDMKYQRLEGGYKDDTIVDRIAYDAFLAEEVRKLETT